MSSLVKKIKDILWGKGVISTPRIAQKRSGKVLYLSHFLNFLSIYEEAPPKISLYKWAKKVGEIQYYGDMLFDGPSPSLLCRE